MTGDERKKKKKKKRPTKEREIKGEKEGQEKKKKNAAPRGLKGLFVLHRFRARHFWWAAKFFYSYSRPSLCPPSGPQQS